MHPHSLLIVNDYPGGEDAYRDLLELDGYRVHTTTSCEAAIRIVLAHRPELVLVDGDPEGIHPVILGARICEETERRGARTPTLVAVRGDLAPGKKEAFTKFSEILEKPLDFGRLNLTLRKSVSDWLLRLQETSSANK